MCHEKDDPHRVLQLRASYGELPAEYPTCRSHVATQLDEEVLKFYEERAKELRHKWGSDECGARRKAYAEMLHRFLPEGHPVLRYYAV